MSSVLSQIRIQIQPGIKIWCSSDLHLGHNGIVRGQSQWRSGTRDFDTLARHDDMIINQINKYVKEEDIFIIDGDFCFGPKSNVEIYRKRINCKNVYLAIGNHDDHIKDDPEIQKLFTRVSHVLEFRFSRPSMLANKHEKIDVIFAHYSMNTWNMSNRGSIMLYGHSHGMLAESPYRTRDIGVDTNPYFKPYDLINEIFPEMMKRPFRNHHPEELIWWKKLSNFLRIKKYELEYRK